MWLIVAAAMLITQLQRGTLFNKGWLRACDVHRTVNANLDLFAWVGSHIRVQDLDAVIPLLRVKR